MDNPTLPFKAGGFVAEIDPGTGALTALRDPRDPQAMNWVSHARENAWALASHAWGLGFVAMTGGVGLQRWQVADAVRITARRAVSRYRLGALRVELAREPAGGDEWTERLVFRNAGRTPITVSNAGVYLPFNDNYPDAVSCLQGRCHAHIWCGTSAAQVCALRMRGPGPHLGLVLTEGRFSGYQIEGRAWLHGSSNQRGAMLFTMPGFTLAPGGAQGLAWRLFWHQGWADFEARLSREPAHIAMQAERYTLIQGRPLRVRLSRRPKTLTLDGRALRPAASVAPVPRTLGEHTLEAKAGSATATLKAMVIPPVAALLRARAQFIVERQQVTDRHDPLHGALLCYDNLAEARVCDPNWGDQNEGRERLGMGAFLAQMLTRRRDARTVTALRHYHAFVRHKLQRRDGRVLNGVGDPRERLYNYIFSAQFYLKLYQAFGEPEYLRDFYTTMRAYYRRGGRAFYAIPIPLADGLGALEAAGWRREAALLRRELLAHADQIARVGDRYPPHEVNFEQSIVSPGALMLLEAHLVSGDPRYLTPARRQLELLEGFQGRQPDYHLHEIAIRHWDGYWFGKLKLWGDTFPHYWSALSGWVFYRAWQVFGDEDYRRRARLTLMNNLCSFTPEGRASCAYIYPDAINGEPARKFDPLANDQDWALVLLLDAARLDPAFEREEW